MKAWLKGGLIGAGIGAGIFIILFIISLIFPQILVIQIDNYQGLLIALISYCIIGIIIGALGSFFKNKKLRISLITGIILLVLPFFLGVYPEIYSILSYLFPVVLIPLIIYSSGTFVNKIKENNRKIFWGLLISFIASGLFLLKQYLFYLAWGAGSRGGIALWYLRHSIFPNFIFPSLTDLLLKSDFFEELLFKFSSLGSVFFRIIADLVFVFIIYFIIGTVIGFIIGKIKLKKPD